jgi:hypothetical protein
MTNLMRKVMKSSKVIIVRLRTIAAFVNWKQSRLSLLTLLGSFVLATRSLEAVDIPREVSLAATNGLPVFLAMIPPDFKHEYGFPDDADLSTVSLGSPVLMHTIQPAALSSNQVSDTVSSLVSESSMWFFPLLMGSEVRAMMVVDRQGSVWKAVSLGYAPLAREWNQVLNQWPASKGFHPRLIAVFQAKQFYFTVPEIGERNLTPLLSPWNAAASTKAAPLGAGQSSTNYSRLGTLSIELDKLKTMLNRVDFKTGR